MKLGRLPTIVVVLMLGSPVGSLLAERESTWTPSDWGPAIFAGRRPRMAARCNAANRAEGVVAAHGAALHARA